MQFTTISLSALLCTVSLAAPGLQKRQESCTLPVSWTHYDQDQDGRVFGSDLSRISISTGENLSLAEGDALVAEWDQNGDGWLTQAELTDAIGTCS